MFEALVSEVAVHHFTLVDAPSVDGQLVEAHSGCEPDRAQNKATRELTHKQDGTLNRLLRGLFIIQLQQCLEWSAVSHCCATAGSEE